MTTKTTYKVGDKVRILDASKIYACEAKDGDILKVIDVDFANAPVLLDTDGERLSMLSGELKYIEKVAEQVAKFKVGDKVKVIADDEFVAKGTVLTIKHGPQGAGMGGNYYFEENDGIILGDDLQLISQKPTKNQRINTLEQAQASLEQEVEALKAEVAALKAATAPENIARELAEGLEKHMLMPTQKPYAKEAPKSPNEQRKAIIAEAKAFVEEYSGVVKVDTTPYTSSAGDTIVKLFVNEEKRTVTAVPYLVHVGSSLSCDKKFAKCAPDDVFNADIGKAIALGLALGLDVKRFEQAVQPTEVVAGMKVAKHSNANIGVIQTVEKLIDNPSPARYPGQAFRTEEVGGWIAQSQVNIIDDTGAQY